MKVVIVGGGASGMALSVMLKQKRKDIEVTLLEKQQRVCKKLLVTGNGQCNISNAKCDLERYHGEGAELAAEIIKKFDYEKQTDFFSSIGLELVTEADGKLYPKSYQASSVVDALRFAAEDLGVMILTEREVTEIRREKQGFLVVADKPYFADVAVLATGSVAGGKLGCESGYKMLKSLGHKINSLTPAIVQLKTEKEVVKSLKGIKVETKVSAVKDGEILRSEFGELLFTDYGLSGPAVMQISGTVIKNNCDVSVDFEPKTDIKALEEKLLSRKEILSNRPVSEFLNGFINIRLGQVLLGLSVGKTERMVGELKAEEIKKLAKMLKQTTFKVTGDMGFANAQVASGGASTNQFFYTLESKKCKGLFVMGELLDVDGDCGGFNLSFAWSSAKRVSDTILERLSGELC